MSKIKHNFKVNDVVNVDKLGTTARIYRVLGTLCMIEVNNKIMTIDIKKLKQLNK